MAKNSKLLSIAKRLRKDMTRAEKMLWEEIRNNKLGIKFRRQAPFIIGNYKFIVDFYAPKIKLIIEVDGDIHLKPEINEVDKIREKVFMDLGYEILRFKNNDIYSHLENVIKQIKEVMNNGAVNFR